MKKIGLSGVLLAAGLAWAGAASADVKMGVAGPVTGPNASFGAQLTQGVGQAAEDFNKSGGILGQKISVETGDDVSDPKQGVSVANKFVGDGVKFVVGHFNSGVTIPASEVYADNGILFITPSATNPKVTDRKLWDAFRTCGRDDQQGKLWADLALGKLKDKKIAILHDKTPYGQGLADAAKGFMNAGGKKEVLYEGINPGEKDYSAVVSKIKASGAEYLMWGGLHTEGGLLIRQMRDQGMNTVMISGDGITDDEFAQIGGPGVEGTLMSFGPEPRNNPNAKDVIAEFKAKNYDPQGYTLYSYAAMQIFKEAAEATKSLDPKKMAAYMHEGKPFHTVLGDISYDKKGDRTNVDYVWYVWEKGADGKITYHQQQAQ
jgi:branched-chain amino acid transport system substrate-binding protein